MNSDKFKKNYLKVVNYMEQFNVKHEIRKILEVILSEDIFFGYERNQGTDEFMIQRLPTNYCKLYSIERGVLNFAFNFSYFDTRKKELENYPSEFSEMYSEYIETGNNWMVLDGNKSVCFKLRETYPYSIPVFSGAFEDLLDLDDTKDLIKTKLRLENFMLLQQKIPFKKEPKSEKDMLISLDSVKMFHANIKLIYHLLFLLFQLQWT